MSIINNRNPLDTAQITFSENIEPTLNIYILANRLLGSAVRYKEKDRFITQVNVKQKSAFARFNINLDLEIILDGDEIYNSKNGLWFYMNDEDDTTEDLSARIRSITFDESNKIKPILKADYDPKYAELLRDSHKTIIDDYKSNAYKDLLAVLEKIKELVVKVDGLLHTIIVEYDTSRVFGQVKKIDTSYVYSLSYADVLIKLAGVNTIYNLTAPNLTFVYKNKDLTLAELLEVFK